MPVGEHPPQKLPKEIFVQDYRVRSGKVFRVDREGEELTALKKNLGATMADNLIRRLPEHVAPARSIARSGPIPYGDHWMISGRFERVEQGSRLLRAIFGLGLGRTTIDTVTTVSDLSGGRIEPFLVIRTTGGSGAMPGMVGAIPMPGTTLLFILGGFAANGASGANSGLSYDSVRTSREVVAALSEYLQRHGLIPPDRALTPKRLGEINAPAWLQGSGQPATTH